MKDFLDTISIDDSLVREAEDRETFITDRRIIVSTYISDTDGRFKEPDYITSLIKKRLDATDFKESVLKFKINTVTAPDKRNIYTDVRINGKICNSVDGFKLLWALNYGYQTTMMKNCVITFIPYDSEYIDKSTEEILFGNLVVINVNANQYRYMPSYMFENDVVYEYSKDSKWQYNVPIDTEEVSKIANLVSRHLVDTNDVFSNTHTEILRLYEYCGMLSGLIDSEDIVERHIRSAMSTFDSDSQAENKSNRWYNNFHRNYKPISQGQRTEIENIIESSSKRFVGIDDVLRNLYWAADERYCARSLFIITKENGVSLMEEDLTYRELVIWNGFPEQCCTYRPSVYSPDSWMSMEPDYNSRESVYSDNTNNFIRNIGKLKKRNNNVIQKLKRLYNGWGNEFDCVVSSHNPAEVMFVIKLGDVVDYNTNAIISASIGFYGPYNSVVENIKVLFGVNEKS